jgi:hypothetical protein
MASQGLTDIMSLRTRFAWNAAVYVLALVVYLTLSDGEGRFELLLWLFVFFGPLLILIDMIVAYRRSKK